LLDAVQHRLAGQREPVERLRIAALPARALLQADASQRDVAAALEQVVRARALVIATPVYKAAYSGLLKVFLDLLPQGALKNKVVLPLATGGSPHHMLALDYALRPVLQSLAPRQILPGVYATDALVTLMPEGPHHFADDLAERLDEAVAGLVHELQRPAAFIPFIQPANVADARCSA
jgi:FMN reductase